MTSTSRVVLAVAFLLMVTSCSQRPDAVEYFDQMNRIGQQQDAGGRSILPPGAAPTHDAVTDLINLRRTGLQEAQAIIPPVELRSEHLAFVETLRFQVDLAEEFLARTEVLDADEFRDALFASTDIDQAARLFAEACVALEQAATRVGVEGADLSC